MKPRSARQHHARSGFTLAEIVIAMTILALISGSVMAMLLQAGDTAADIRDTDKKDEEISRFIELLGHTIEALPSDATMEMTIGSESASGYPELKISDAVGAFIFGEDVGSAGELVIGLQPQDDSDGSSDSTEPLYQLAISRDSFSPEDTDGDGMVFGAGADDFLTPDTEGRYWLPLVSDIISAGWRYWDEENQEWLTEWEEENLPPLMELSIEDSHRPGAVRAVFELPDHVVSGEGGRDDTAESSPAPEASTVSQPSQSTRPSLTSSGSRPQARPEGGKGKGGFGGKGKGFGGKGKGGFGKGKGGKGGGDGKGGKGGGKGGAGGGKGGARGGAAPSNSGTPPAAP